MRAWDYTLDVPSRPGSVAVIGEELGRAGINIEGICGFEFQGRAILHVLVTDPHAEQIFERFKSVGFEVVDARQVLVETIDNRPGAIGDRTRRIADEGISLSAIYMASDSRLVLGCDDLEALEEAWRSVEAAVTP